MTGVTEKEEKQSQVVEDPSLETLAAALSGARGDVADTLVERARAREIYVTCHDAFRAFGAARICEAMDGISFFEPREKALSADRLLEPHPVVTRLGEVAHRCRSKDIPGILQQVHLLPPWEGYRFIRPSEISASLAPQPEYEARQAEQAALQTEYFERMQDEELWLAPFRAGWDAELGRIVAAQRLSFQLAEPATALTQLEEGADSGADLLDGEAPAIEWTADGLLPRSGLLLLAGRPKGGKSTLAYQALFCAATGLDFLDARVTPCKVALVSVDDPNRWRVRRRMQLLAATMPGANAPEIMQAFRDRMVRTFYDWPKAHQFLPTLELLLTKHRDLKLVVVDAYATIKQGRARDQPLFDGDYKELSAIRQFAHAHGIMLLLLIHTRKAQSTVNDPIDEVQGTSGVTAATDDLMGLRRDVKSGLTVLSMRGRNLDMNDVALRFRPATKNTGGGGYFVVEGDAAAVASGRAKQALRVLADADCPLSLREIAIVLNMLDANVQHPLEQLVEKQLVIARRKPTGAGSVYTITDRGRRQLQSDDENSRMEAALGVESDVDSDRRDEANSAN